MRRLVLSIIAASGLVVVGAGSASAEPVPTTGAAKPVPGKKVCKIEDSKLTALSGMVATKDGFVVINDGVELASGRKVFFLDEECKITKSVPFSGSGPRDTEDMALSADGKKLWIADTGDNDKDRSTVGLWSMPSSGSDEPKIHRLSYPDGDKHDAEALLLNGDGTPIIVTKEATKTSGVYVPTAALKANNSEGVPMRKVGEVTIPPSTTPASGLAALGRGTIVGGAIAPGGAKVTLRTYTDALEFDVANGDVLAALKTKPRVTPLPNEPFGEAISYSADGKHFLTVSDLDAFETQPDNWILQYSPTVGTAKKPGTSGGVPAGGKGQSWFDKLSLNDITWLVGGVGILGAVLVGFGVFGIVRARRRPPKIELAAARKGRGTDPKPLDPEAATALISTVRDDDRPGGDLQGAGKRAGGVYGGASPSAPPAGAGVYGAKPVPTGPAGNGAVYGGESAPRPGGGGVYGAPPPAGRPAGAPAGRPTAAPGGRPTGAPGGRPTGAGGRPPAPPGVYHAQPGGHHPPPNGYQAPADGYQPPHGGYQAPPPGQQGPTGRRSYRGQQGPDGRQQRNGTAPVQQPGPEGYDDLNYGRRPQGY